MKFLSLFFGRLVLTGALVVFAGSAAVAAALELGTRRELFVDDFLIDIAAAVKANVDDDPLLVGEAVDLVAEANQRRLIHRADVDIRDVALGVLLDHIAVVFHPLLVLDVRE